MAREYEVELQTTVTIRAKNEEEAEARAEELCDWVTFCPPKGKPWARQQSEPETEVIVVTEGDEY